MAYTASKSPTKDRPGFSISFRHPLKLDSKGKPGLKIRRGLGTTDPAEADRLVAQMNQLLGDESWWNSERYPDAGKQFDKRIVDAFFDRLQAAARDPFEIREEVIPLPSRVDGYVRAILAGTTGAGKTTLLRILTGSDPERDRFPSTSTAKTTISDTEIIPADGPYSAVITFFPETTVRVDVEDCVMNACTAAWDGLHEDKVAERFLNHPDQRFRLSYILGSWQKPRQEQKEDDWDFGDPAEASPSDDEAVSSSELERLQKRLRDYIARIRGLAAVKGEPAIAPTPSDPSTESADDRELAEEQFQTEVYGDEAFWDIVHDVMEDIQARFEWLTGGDLSTGSGSSKWPVSWTYASDDRADFLKHVRWFSSNFAPSFGRLLTPLVEGLRVKGPFYPEFTDRRAKIVLLDGQGLGHTPDSTNAVTTHLTQRFSDVDVILLVDNAAQPVQAAAQAVLGTVASSGNHAKLGIAFTHFDQVKGPNLPKYGDKRAHVLASVHNCFSKLKETITGPIIPIMERTMDDACFMLGALQGTSAKLPNGVKQQLDGLLTFIESKLPPPVIPDAKPVYDPSGLGFAVQRAADSFQTFWSARLGLAISSTVTKEHWTRVKALNRRIANETDVEYSSLRPVADLVRRITEEVSNYLDAPLGWTRQPTSDEEAQAAIDPIRQAVFASLHDLALARVIREHLVEWRRALEYSGRGSADRRAVEIRAIYDLAAPVPGTVNSERAIRFMSAVRNIVTTAITDSGGSLRVS